MALVDNSKNLHLNGTRLSGDTKDEGSWTGHATIDLNSRLGNKDGDFDLGGSNFAGSAQNIRLEGTKLRAKLKKSDRHTEVEATLDLAIALRVVDGSFDWVSRAKYQYFLAIANGGKELQDSIRQFTADSRNLQVSGTVLSGSTRKTNGAWTEDKIDLNYKLGNNNGRFHIDGSNFGHTARKVEVEGTTLQAILQNSLHTYDETFIELAAVLKIVDGSFFFRSEYETRIYTSTPATSLADNSRNLRITNQSWLSGETKKNGSWTNDSINLALKLGNRDGEFDFRGDINFHRTAEDIRVEGATLRAFLKKAVPYHVEASLNLGLILKVVDGKFNFIEYERRLSPSDFNGPGLVANSRNLYIRGGRLSGETKRKGNSWTTDSIDLGSYIGNDRGRFNLDQRRFTWSASEFKLKDTTLLASLNNGSSWPSEAALDLSLVLKVDENGKFIFISEHQRKRIVSSVFCMFVEKVDGKLELNGLCLNKYGKLEARSIDLNNYYKVDVDSGSFESDYYDERSRNLADMVQDANLKVTSAEVLLDVKFRDGRNLRDASVNLNLNIENRDGDFRYERHTRPSGREGWVTKFIEGLPVVGYFQALLHLFNGDTEWAKRAAAMATNSTIVFVGVTIGGLIGGPLGAALGAGIATPIAIAAEVEIKKTIAEDVRIQFEDATVGRYIYETLRNMLVAGAAAKFAKWLDKIGPSDFSAAGVALGIGKNVSKKAVKKSMKEILDALIGDQLPREWLEAEEKVRRL